MVGSLTFVVGLVVSGIKLFLFYKIAVSVFKVSCNRIMIYSNWLQEIEFPCIRLESQIQNNFTIIKVVLVLLN